jgi:hypothetical protein
MASRSPRDRVVMLAGVLCHTGDGAEGCSGESLAHSNFDWRVAPLTEYVSGAAPPERHRANPASHHPTRRIAMPNSSFDH